MKFQVSKCRLHFIKISGTLQLYIAVIYDRKRNVSPMVLVLRTKRIKQIFHQHCKYFQKKIPSKWSTNGDLSLADNVIPVLIPLTRKEGNVLFNDALNTFYLRLYGIRYGKGLFRWLLHMGYSIQLAARVLLYGMRNSSMGPP